MKYRIPKHLFAIAVFAAGLVQATAMSARAETGLLLIAHGAPMPKWNAPVLEFGEKVAAEALKSGRFKAVRTAMLEFTKPDVPGAVTELEAEGCDRIVAVPLFIAPSGHSHFDVPAVLGIYTSPSIAATIAEEGGEVARPKAPILLTQTLDEGDLLARYALDEVKKLSKNPSEEALVLLAHGDENHHRMVDRLMRRLTTYCCGRSGIDDGDWAFVEIGQSYASNGVGAIMAAAQRKKRVLVVGIYVSSSAASIHRRVMAQAAAGRPDFKPFEGKDVVFSQQGVIAHPNLVQYVLNTANEALDQAEGTAGAESSYKIR